MHIRTACVALVAGMMIAGRGLPQTPAAPALTLHDWMTSTVIPDSTVLWDVANNAMDEKGAPDGKKVSAAQWTTIADTARRIKETAVRMAGAPKVVVAAPGTKIQDQENEGASNAAQVQGYIDKDRAAFNAFALALGDSADAFGAAARTKSAVKLAAASDGLDAVCEACHTKFWYPQQAAAKN